MKKLTVAAVMSVGLLAMLMLILNYFLVTKPADNIDDALELAKWQREPRLGYDPLDAKHEALYSDGKKLAEVTQKALDGDVEAQRSLAYFYFDTNFTPDTESAFHWLYKAAQSGDVSAQQSLKRWCRTEIPQNQACLDIQKRLALETASPDMPE